MTAALSDTTFTGAGSFRAEAPGDDPTGYGGLGDDVDTDTEFAVAAELEETLLSALMWAPQDLAAAITEILAAPRDNGADYAPFVRPVHAVVFDAIAAVATNTQPSPVLVNARLMETGQLRSSAGGVRNTMLGLAAPINAPMTLTDNIAYLAIKIVDAHYRRGYTALLTRMTQHRDESPIEDLAGHWAQLTGYQQRAETDWANRREALEALGRR